MLSRFGLALEDWIAQWNLFCWTAQA